MLDCRVTSIDLWVKTLSNDDLLALLIGCPSDELPPLGSYYDFQACLGEACLLCLFLRFLTKIRHICVMHKMQSFIH